jgi:small subunit ribosomal protein S16
MVRIRLRRTGAKNNPAYRIVVADQKSPRDGAFIDTIGHYLPTRQPHVVEIDEEKARHWLSKGAQPSDTAASLLRQKGILDAQGKIAPPGSTDPYANGATPVAAAAPVAAAPVAAPVVADIVEVAPVAAEPTEAVPAADAPAAEVA